MKPIKFTRDKAGWYHTDTEIFHYVIKRMGRQTWVILEAVQGKNSGTHIATATRVADAKAWLTQRIQKETLMV